MSKTRDPASAKIEVNVLKDIPEISIMRGTNALSQDCKRETLYAVQYVDFSSRHESALPIYDDDEFILRIRLLIGHSGCP